MANTELTPQQKAHLEEFDMDSKVVGKQLSFWNSFTLRIL